MMMIKKQKKNCKQFIIIFIRTLAPVQQLNTFKSIKLAEMPKKKNRELLEIKFCFIFFFL